MTDRQILLLIGRNVRSARLGANLTQECLAELVGVHWQTVSYLEHGRHPIPVTTFARLCQALDMSPNRLLDGLPAADQARMRATKKMLARKRKPPVSEQNRRT